MLNLDNHRETSGSHYKPHPLPTNTVRLRAELTPLITALACNNHEAWCLGLIRNGWQYATCTESKLKQHAALLPYALLPVSAHTRRWVVLFRRRCRG